MSSINLSEHLPEVYGGLGYIIGWKLINTIMIARISKELRIKRPGEMWSILTKSELNNFKQNYPEHWAKYRFLRSLMGK